MKTGTLLASIVLSGLIGGLMFGWSVSVLPGLRKVSDVNYLSTMQSINRHIINPRFTIPFVVTPVVLAVAAIVHFQTGQTGRGWILALACLSYIFGVGAVTAGGNIPLNNTLDRFVIDAASPEAIAAQRGNYEGRWNAWHYARTVASIGAFALTASAALVATESD